MAKRWLLGGAVWAVLTGLAFWLLNPVLAAFVGIFAATLVVVVAVAGDWERHPTFEQRELDRARRRAAKRERTKDARARDRALWEAHQARKSGR
ncbi:hypothetical protein ACI8AF_16815 [Blastococcus sp. SYSU D00669]